MAEDVRICFVEERDILELTAMESRSSVRPWREADLRGSLEAGDGCYKLTVGDSPLGYCVVRDIGEDMEVLNLVVDETAQRQGYGGHLLQQVIALPRYAGLSRVWLEVAQDNDPAQALYCSLGFVRAGIRQDYYRREGCPSHAYVMCKNL